MPNTAFLSGYRCMRLNRGFSLLEILLSLTLLGLFSVGLLLWHQAFQQHLQVRATHQQQQAEMQRWLFWIWRDVYQYFGPMAWQPATGLSTQWLYEAEANCLLYGEQGVRIKNQSIQWRPQQADCSELGWQALTDPQRVNFTALKLEANQLCLLGKIPKPLVAIQAQKEQIWEVCLPWML